MKRYFITCLLCLVTFGLFAQEDNGDIVKKGDRLPEFYLTSEKYGSLSSRDLEGKVALITIFATWCGPCQKELADIEARLWPKFREKEDFVLLVVGREHTDTQLETYNERKGFTFPLYPDPERGFTNHFSTKMIPRTYLINKSGEVVETSVGFQEGDIDELMRKIEFQLR